MTHRPDKTRLQAVWQIKSGLATGLNLIALYPCAFLLGFSLNHSRGCIAENGGLTRDHHRGSFLAILAFMLGLLVVACERPSSPAPTTRPAAPMICVVSGLGTPQLGDVATMLRVKFPNAETVDFATAPRNAYRTDLAGYVLSNPHSRLVLIGHSYGASKVAATWGSVGNVDLAVMLDPVKEVGQSSFVVPPEVRRVVNVTGDFLPYMLIRETIHGPNEELKVHADHNKMAHDPATLSLVEDAVGRALR
jgi:hypothetical protein